MKSYLLDFFPAIKRIDRKLDNLSQLLHKHWILFEENKEIETKFIFKEEKILYVSINGIIQDNCSWSYIDEHYINVSYNNKSYLFQFGLIDNEQKILIFKLSGTENYIIFQNEIHKRINASIQELLNEEYLNLDEKVVRRVENSEIDYTNFNPKYHPKIVEEIETLNQRLLKIENENSNFDSRVAKNIFWTFVKEHRISSTHDIQYKSFITELASSSIKTKYIEESLSNGKSSDEFIEQLKHYLKHHVI